MKKKNSKKIPPPNNSDKWMFPRCIYKTEDSDIPKPCCFKGEIQLKNTKNDVRQVHIFLHGFIFPCKWHYGVLKHMLCAPKFRKNDDRERWETFEGKEIGIFDMKKIKECCENKDQTSCDESYCNKNGLFEKIHPELKDYCRRYLNQAVSFFGENSEKKIRIWESKIEEFNTPKFIETDCRNEVKISDMARQLGMKGPEREEILILRGYSYDWESAEEPAIHLYPLTLYAGKLDGYSDRPDLEYYKLIDDGNLNIL
ncbi:MAG: type III-E CRISPR-associated protein Csx31 [Desulfococcaceae bacterium]|nr:type III-E CRISPR-associated protein Csx31 [Desulfococcaceae bacterium]